MNNEDKDDSQARKDTPVFSGFLNYFPLAVAEVARLSKVGNDKHNPGEPLHWSRDKSDDHADCLARHLIDAGEMDDDGFSHTVKVAWRAMALLQVELESGEKASEEAMEIIRKDMREAIFGKLEKKS